MNQAISDRIWLCGLIGGVLVVPAAARGQAVLYVDIDASGPTHDGASWCSGFLNLQDALSLAREPDATVSEIRIAEGVYRPDLGTDQTPEDRYLSFALINDVKVRGGFAGCGAAAPDERDISAYETVLSGDLLGDDSGDLNDPSRFDNCYHVITGSETDSTATALDGLTVADGNAAGSYPHYCGGGMYNEAGSPTITACTFTHNTADSSGGAIYNVGGSDPTLTECVFASNMAQYGGAIHNRDESDPDLKFCVFLGNTAEDWGGGIYNYPNSSPTLSNCAFVTNSADGGGAMYSFDGGSEPVFNHCIFRRNSAVQWGGAVWTMWSDLTLRNCVFSANSAGLNGGGLRSDDGVVTLSNCTLVDNSAEHFGGGISSPQSKPVVTSCILWGNTNTAGSVDSAQIQGNLSLVRHSCIEGWSEGGPGEGNTGEDPLLVDPRGADMIPGTADDDLRLSPGSPCINTGDPDYSVGPDETDLDGYPRVLCGRIDMGVYEFGIGDCDCDQSVDLADLACWADCLTGPDSEPLSTGCEACDFDADRDVDLDDFADFQTVCGTAG